MSAALCSELGDFGPFMLGVKDGCRGMSALVVGCHESSFLFVVFLIFCHCLDKMSVLVLHLHNPHDCRVVLM